MQLQGVLVTIVVSAVVAFVAFKIVDLVRRAHDLDDLGGLRWNQWVALAAIVVGVVALLLTRGRTWDVDPARDATFQMRALAGGVAEVDAVEDANDIATDDADDGWVDPALVALGAASVAGAADDPMPEHDEPAEHDGPADSGDGD